MRTHSPLVIDVHELLEQPGARRDLVFSAPVEGLGVGIVHIQGALRFELVLEPLEGGIIAQGEVAGRYVGTCARCLTPLDADLAVRVAEVYRPLTDMWEEGYVVKEGTIDLEPLVRDAVGLALPLTPLCRPDCAGLCPQCGADRNAGDCGCKIEQGDLRWSALKNLRLENG